MKKIFTHVVGMILGLVAFNASADVIFSASANNCVTITNNGDTYDLTTTPTPYPFSGFMTIEMTGKFVSIEDFLPSGASDGNKGIDPGAISAQTDEYSKLSIGAWMFDAGHSYVINVIPAAAEEEGVVIVGAQPGDTDHFTVKYSNEMIPAADGKIGPFPTPTSGSIIFNAESGYKFTSITDQFGTEYLLGGETDNKYLFASALPKDAKLITLTVTLRNTNTTKTASVDITMDGNADDVQIYNGLDKVKIESNATTKVNFDPETQSKFIVSSSSMKGLYKVELNGNAIAEDGGSYEMTVKDGDKMFISSVFPNIPVTVNLTGDYECIYALYLDNEDIWSPEVRRTGTFTCNMGDLLDIVVDSENYDVKEVTVNDVIASPWALYLTCDKDIYTINFDASIVNPRSLTINTANYEKVTVSSVVEGWAGYELELLLDSNTNEVEITQDVEYLNIVAAEGWILTSVTKNGTEVLSNTEDATIATVNDLKDGDVIVITNMDKNDPNTGIGNIGSETIDDATIFNLQGVRVNATELPAGLYIKDGKKIIVK